jgi:hypothetical protein
MSQDNDPAPESNPSSGKKIEAIYSLREAAEAKALAEVKAAIDPTPEARDELLDAQLNLEAKTQDAVEACHECGHSHGADEPHYRNNVIDFKSPERTQS